MAAFCLNTGVSPRDYPYLTRLQRDEFNRLVHERK